MKYLTQDQACEALGVSPEELKTMVVEGRVREIRDGGKVMYSADEIDRLQSMEGSSIVDLAITDDAELGGDSYASALSSLADSSSDLSLLDDSTAADAAQTSGSDDDLSLAELPDELPASPAGSVADDFTSDIGLVPAGDDVETIELSSDVDLTGSSVIGLESADEERPKSKDDTRITKAGISVFDDDELEIDSDPMAKTHVPGLEDEIGGGGGSGLLDLTRESDDTSLGAELLDVISPTEAEETEAEATVDDDAVIAAAPEEDTVETGVVAGDHPFPVQSQAPRRAPVGAMAGAVPVNICMLIGLLGLTLLGLVAAGAVQGVWPSFLTYITKDVVIYSSVFGGLAVITLVVGILGIVAGRK